MYSLGRLGKPLLLNPPDEAAGLRLQKFGGTKQEKNMSFSSCLVHNQTILRGGQNHFDEKTIRHSSKK